MPAPKRNASEQKFLVDFGDTMKRQRLAAGLTQEGIAALLGISRGTVINIENGQYAFSFMVGIKICRILKIDIEQQMDDALSNISSLFKRGER